MEKYAICTIIKNEHRYICEWIDYNISIGFNTIHLYEDNGSKSHKDLLSKYPNVFIHQWSECPKIDYTDRDYKQVTMMQHFINNYKKDYDWVAFIDVDEFIRFEEGYNLHKICNEFNKHNAIYLQWRMIGASGHITRPLGMVQDNYFNCDKELNPNYVQFYSKSLCNLHKRCIINNVHKIKYGVFTDGANANNRICRKKSWIDHYFTKSFEDWIERFKERGDVVEGNRKFNEFFIYNKDDREKYIKYYADVIDKNVYNYAKVELRGRLCNQLFIISKVLTDNPNTVFYFTKNELNSNVKQILDNSGIIYHNWNGQPYYKSYSSFFQDASLHNEKILREKIKLPIKSKQYDFVIHVRREDYLLHQDKYYILTKEYIEKMYNKYYKGGSIAIVSTIDGIIWAREQEFRFDYEEVYNTPLECLSVISNAKTIICSCSSFSVMGCMLNDNEDKICVIPKPYDKISDNHNVIIPKYFNIEKL